MRHLHRRVPLEPPRSRHQPGEQTRAPPKNVGLRLHRRADSANLGLTDGEAGLGGAAPWTKVDVKNLEKTIEDADTLRAHYGPPLEVAIALNKTRLDKYHRAFIALSPFVCISASDASGQPSISPKGDAPGFVQVLDDNTLMIPDRPGNQQITTFSAIVENPKVGLLFLVPGRKETLRIEGRATITLDDDVLAAGAVRGKLPPAALVITVTAARIHCGKCVVRSNLWDPAIQIDKDAIASYGQIIKDQAEDLHLTVETADELVERGYREELY
ncbi:MAG: pyridoxamine 5'-phosphate oxidase family protein [Proteobacteria bacterium]|nr:pyridoxamine 5'-phosphate oxidase family protein [Pseudomonadota bacterium]